MIKIFEVQGTDYEMGCQIGKQFKKYLQKAIRKYEKKLDSKVIYLKVKEMEDKCKKDYPRCLEEIYGRADGSEVSRDAMLLMFFPEVYKKADGCTTLIFKKEKDNFLFCHNEDGKSYNSNNVALIKYNYKNFWVVAYTMAEKLAGNAFTYNSYGLVFSSNYIFDTAVDLNNISRYIAVKEVINSSSVEEAVDKLEKCKVASPFSLNILDVNLNIAVNVEKDIEGTYVTKINNRYARANHFIAKSEGLPKEPISSKFRYNKAKELLTSLNKKESSITSLINILSYETRDYYSSIFKDPNKYKGNGVTVANFSIESKTKKIRIHDYLNDNVFIFDYNNFMKDS
ncbi:MAG: C45 family peptidase [Bacilli bacterium]